MKHTYYKQTIIIILSLLICIFSITGCSKKDEQPSKEETEETEKKPPDTLKKLEESILDVIDGLDKKDEEEEKEAEIKIESTTEIKTEEDAQKSETENKQETKQEVKKESPDDKKWKSSTKKVEEIHKQWNSLQPELAKAGTPRKPLDDFSNNLNTLTTYADAKDMQNTLFYSNELYRIIADFMEQYKSKIPPDIKRLSYFIRDAKYNGMINQWEKSNSSIANLKSHWAIIKPQTKKEQESAASKTEFSINELEKVVQQANINLTKIKSDIALDNLKKLEESFEKAESKE